MPTISDYFAKASNGTAPVATTLASQKSVSASSLSLSLSTGWPTDTPVHFLLYKVDANNAMVDGSLTLWKGVLSGTTVSNLTLKSGSDDVYAAGSVVEMAPTSAWADDVVTGLLVEHGQTGLHTKVNGNTVPSGTDTVALLNATQTFSHKTLDSTNTFNSSVVPSSALNASTFNLNMKTATNAANITPTNTDQDLASSGVSISFTVSAACNALVTVSIGVQSSADYEFRPEVRLGGVVKQTFDPQASTGGGRAQVRGFTTVVALSSGVNTLSAGLFLSSASSPSIQAGAAVISALVLGNVTA